MPWPPAPPTIEARPVEAVLADHEDLIKRIRVCYGSDGHFDELVMPVIRRYAAYVHDLPATPDAHFPAPGGLLRLGLEVGFFSLQGCDSRIFLSGASLEKRQALEPRWRLAALIAGLCCELHRVPAQMTVSSPQGTKWPCHLESLGAWLTHKAVHAYSVQWCVPRHPLTPWGVFVVRHIASPPTMAYLAEHNDEIVEALLGSVGNLVNRHNVIDDLVRRALAVVVDQDLIRQFGMHGVERRGSHLMRFAVDAIRRLVASQSKWQINQPGSVIAWRHDGLFLSWPQAGKLIVNLWAKETFPGMPKDAEDLLHHLEQVALVTRPCAKEYWQIAQPQTGEIRSAVKVADPHWLLPMLRDAAVQCEPPAQECLPPESPEAPELATPESPGVEPPLMAVTERAGPIRLVAPLRLPELLKAALARLIASLNKGEERAEVVRLDRGVFVPLLALEQQGIPSATAVRQLKEVDMLVPSESGLIEEMTFRGEHTAGVLIDAAYINGAE